MVLLARLDLTIALEDARTVALCTLEDSAVCLVDATITVSLQADGTFAYDWRHPFFDVAGSGTLRLTS